MTVRPLLSLHKSYSVVAAVATYILPKGRRQLEKYILWTVNLFYRVYNSSFHTYSTNILTLYNLGSKCNTEKKTISIEAVPLSQVTCIYYLLHDDIQIFAVYQF